MCLLGKIFYELNYDFGVLCKSDAEKLASCPQKPNWTLFPKKVTQKILHTDFGTVACILPPELTRPKELEQRLSEINALTKTALQDKKIRLIILFSPWGQELENLYLKKAQFPPHILLGSNTGSGLVRLRADNKSLWIRPRDRGKDIFQIEIFKFPPVGTQKKWPKRGVKARSVPLGDDILQSQKILELTGDRG